MITAPTYLRHGLIAAVSMAVATISSATTYYVDDTGTDSTANGQGTSSSAPWRTLQYAADRVAAGDTVRVMAGTYRNANFGNSKTNAAVCQITASGTSSSPIIFTGHSSTSRPVIEFDGSAAFLVKGNYIQISQFIIKGIGNSITKADAQSHRQDNPALAYYQGIGVNCNGNTNGGSRNVTVNNCNVSKCPNSGIRSDRYDYVTFTSNDVFDCCWASRSGTSALVVADARAVDTATGYKIKLQKNRTWNNYNLIPIYLPGTANGEYGGPDFVKLTDGRGIYMTRNESYSSGKYYVANNISTNNGFEGIQFHKSSNGVLVNNTAYNNGQSYPDPASPSTRTGRQGMGASACTNVTFRNNIVSARGGYCMYEYEPCTNVVCSHNCLYNGSSDFSSSNSTTASPSFVSANNNASAGDWKLNSGSPARNSGTATDAPSTDIAGTARPQGSVVDMGAYEQN
jgi:parallel beta-helix repeat protein